MTNTAFTCPPLSLSAGRLSGLPVVGELKGNRDVLGLAKVLDRGLQRVLVLAHHSKLVALDPHLELGAHGLDPLAQVARELVRDAGVELHLDLAAALADRLGVAGFEQLGRDLAPASLHAQRLARPLRSLPAPRLDTA